MLKKTFLLISLSVMQITCLNSDANLANNEPFTKDEHLNLFS